MAKKTSVPLYMKLSPNEQAALIEEEIKERRKIRLLQVRKQEKEFAQKVRDNVRNKKEEERRILNYHIKEHLIKEHREQLRQLEETLVAHRKQVGQAHRDAQVIEQEEQRLQELRLLLSSQQRAMAKKREALAMQELTNNQLRAKSMKENAILTRNQVSAIEKERSKSIASSKKYLDSPSLLIMELEANPCSNLSTRRVQGVESFASTYFHLPDNLVHREATPNSYQLDAVQAAEQAHLEEQEHLKQQTMLKDEQQVKAHLRHKHALAQVKLEKERVNLMKDLSLMAREDRTHRQNVLQHLPANLFQPVQQRLQHQEQQQYELEHAFEKLITRHQPNHTDENSEELPTWSESVKRDSSSSKREEEQSTFSSTSSSSYPHYQENTSSELTSITPYTTTNRTVDTTGEGEEKRQEVTNESEPSISTITMSTKDTTNSSQGNSVSRLVGMIRAQQEAWNERIASRQSAINDSTSKRHDSLSISALSNSQCDPISHISPDNDTVHTSTSSIAHSGSVPTNSIAHSGSVPTNSTAQSGSMPTNSTAQSGSMPTNSTIGTTNNSTVHTTGDTVMTTNTTHDTVTTSGEGGAVPLTADIPALTELTIETIEDTINEPSPTAPHNTAQYYQPIYYYDPSQQWYYYSYPPQSYYPPHPPPVVQPVVQPVVESTSTSNNTEQSNERPMTHNTSLSSSAETTLQPTEIEEEYPSTPPPFIPSTPPSLPPNNTLLATPPYSTQVPSPLSPTHSPTTSHINTQVPSPLSPTHSPPLIANPPISTLGPSPPINTVTPSSSSLSSSSSTREDCDINKDDQIFSSHEQERSQFIQSLLVSLQDKQQKKKENSPILSTSHTSSPLSEVDTPPIVQTNSLPPPRGSLSLQEAFKLKKQSFIDKSQARVKLLTDKTRDDVPTTTKPIKKLVTFSSPVLREGTDSSSTKHTPPSIHKGPPDRLLTTARPEKISVKEMLSRNHRMYSKLPEVQEKVKASQRDHEYAVNREKAKKYNQTLRNKMMKKRN